MKRQSRLLFLEDASDTAERGRLCFGQQGAANTADLFAQRSKRNSRKFVMQQAHGALREHENDNIGLAAAHETEQVGEVVLDDAIYCTQTKSRKAKRQKQLHKDTRARIASQQRAEATTQTVQPVQHRAKATSSRLETYTQRRTGNTARVAAVVSNRAHGQQKRGIKAGYRNAKRSAAKGQAASQASHTVMEAGKKLLLATKQAVVSIVKSPVFWIALSIILMTFMIINGVAALFAMSFQGALGNTVATSYTANDTDMLAVEAAYSDLESELEASLFRISQDYAGYQAYHFTLDDIGHDPHALASYLTAVYQAYQLDEVEAELQSLFDAQYTLTLTATTEERYRDDGTGNLVPYDYKTLYITLTSRTLDEVAQARLSGEQLTLYENYLATQGNMPTLFDD